MLLGYILLWREVGVHTLIPPHVSFLSQTRPLPLQSWQVSGQTEGIMTRCSDYVCPQLCSSCSHRTGKFILLHEARKTALTVLLWFLPLFAILWRFTISQLRAKPVSHCISFPCTSILYHPALQQGVCSLSWEQLPLSSHPSPATAALWQLRTGDITQGISCLPW